MRNFEIVYTVTDHSSLVSQLLYSTKKLSLFTDKEDVRIYMTPPYPDQKVQRILRQRSKLVKTKNLTEPVKRNQRFGEKIHLTESPAENILFLDCDTIPHKDITDLFTVPWLGDYDFLARRATAFFNWSDEQRKKWTELFRTEGKTEVLPLINASMMIFRNNLHRKIRPEWIDYIDEDIKNLPDGALKMRRDQVPLSLCLADRELEITWASKRIFSFKWADEDNESWITHGDQELDQSKIRWACQGEGEITVPWKMEAQS